MKLYKDRLVHYLRHMADCIERGDSLRGAVNYISIDPYFFEVSALYEMNRQRSSLLIEATGSSILVEATENSSMTPVTTGG